MSKIFNIYIFLILFSISVSLMLIWAGITLSWFMLMPLPMSIMLLWFSIDYYNEEVKETSAR